MRYPAFIGGSYPSQSPRAAQERTINFYPERVQTSGAKSEWVLYPTPGVTSLVTSTSSPVRALYAQDDRCWAVIGDDFCEISSAGTLTSYGTLQVDVGTDPATICGNGDGGEALFITSGDHGYVFDTCSNTFYPVRFDATTMAVMLDGYFLVLDSATSTVWQSGLLDGTTWNGLAFTQRTAAADPWVSIATLGRELWLFGTSTTEIWYDAGTTPFAFAAQPSGLIGFGTIAPWSVARVGESLLWLARTADGGGVVVQASGPQPRIVSTHALSWVISQYSTISDAKAWGYEDQGHAFYVLTFPTANATWVYDVVTGQWAERSTWNTLTSTFDAWRIGSHAYCWGQHIVGDRSTGSLYVLSVTATTDVDGQPLRRVRRAPVLSLDGKRLFFSRLQLELEVGIGVSGVPLTSAPQPDVGGRVDPVAVSDVTPTPGVDPRVMLAYSNDNGRTWQDAGVCAAGRQGEYRTRVQWHRLGSARDRVFEVAMSDAIPYRIVDCYLDVTPGSER